MHARRLVPAVLTLLLAAALAACAAAPVPTDAVAAAAAQVHDWAWTEQAAPLALGVTHTQDSLNPDEPTAAAQRGLAILRGNGAGWQNQHLMGFGTLNPEPSPGDYQWASLDQRMQLIKDSGGQTVLTLCCAPDWMKGGKPGTTDWSHLEYAPTPDHYADYADLAAKAVARYPQVKRVVVWNELKGFYDQDQNRWDYEDYTNLYNAVYTAVKAVRPDVLVGGPYAVLSSLQPGSDAADASDLSGPWGVADQRSLDIITYWLAHNVGADFIAVDGGTAERSGASASDGTVPVPADKAAQKFADLTAWIRARSPLPIWWSEFYPDVPSGTTGGPSSQASAASTLAAIAAFAQSGVSGALLWGPQGSSDVPYAALWTDSTDAGGGQPTPLTSAWQWLVPRLAAGSVEIGRSPSVPLVAFRAPDGMLVVNLTGQAVTVGAGGAAFPAWGISRTAAP
ncbi:hypothetical protein [Pseudonocardia sp. GCM10023141]|uniref:hypothetical protein n=1 Tax=Pseudonocardia sp. GCM10023141 TaxID=3252653 RepID=UPI003612325A